MATLIDSRLPVHRALYFGGEWQPSSSGRFIDVECPSTGESLGRVPDANADDVSYTMSMTQNGNSTQRVTSIQGAFQFKSSPKVKLSGRGGFLLGFVGLAF
jgi:hypothetical protein